MGLRQCWRYSPRPSHSRDAACHEMRWNLDDGSVFAVLRAIGERTAVSGCLIPSDSLCTLASSPSGLPLDTMKRNLDGAIFNCQ